MELRPRSARGPQEVTSCTALWAVRRSCADRPGNWSQKLLKPLIEPGTSVELSRKKTGAICAGLGRMSQLPIDELTERVIGCAIAVHSALGPGLLESIYRDSLLIELTHAGFDVVREHPVAVVYRGERVRGQLRIDLLVDGRLVVEVKATDRPHSVFQAQVITYLTLANCPAGLLLNFNAPSMRAGLKRLDHPTIYAQKQAARRAKAKIEKVRSSRRPIASPEACEGETDP
jgi:GxxExxY protein